MCVAQARRKRPPLEKALAATGYRYIAGVDEVGRGALAGPLVVAAVLVDVTNLPRGIRDSKLLTPARREVLAGRIFSKAVAVSWVVVDPADIDDSGLHVLNLLALRQAVLKLRPVPDYAISDCFDLGLDMPALGVPKGDTVSIAVGAASIVAKVYRDRLMVEMDSEFPGYGFAHHKGYGTANHWAAIRAIGPSDVHRLSFKGVGCYQGVLAFDERGDSLLSNDDRVRAEG